MGIVGRNFIEKEELVSEMSIIGKIKSVRSLGHAVRMREDRVDERVYLGQSGRRPVSRQTYRWKNGVAKDQKEQTVHEWSELAQDRKKWRTLVS